MKSKKGKLFWKPIHCVGNKIWQKRFEVYDTNNMAHNFFSSIKVAHMTTHSNMIDYEIVHSMRFESKKGKITISTFRLLILNGTKPLGN